MRLFRRVIRWFFLLFGLISGVIVAIAVFVTRRMVQPPRQRLWTTPDRLGLSYEAVHFPAADGLRLSGWFIPGPAGSLRKGGTVLLVHGWQWNRLGETAEDGMANILGTKPVDLMRLAYTLHQDGFQVLMFDLRNHGESAQQLPVTFGREEAADVLGALDYLRKRPDVPADRIGVIGFSAGANALLFALSQTELVRAAIAVQPASGDLFFARAGQSLFGRFRLLITPLVQLLYQAAGGMALEKVQPATAVSAAPDIPILFIRGDADPWGSPSDVQQMADQTPLAQGPLWVEAQDRFAGYNYIVENPLVATAFFEQHFPE
jgi:dipeptidyl aminopeptidase/acylaminoacyl peptidase